MSDNESCTIYERSSIRMHIAESTASVSTDTNGMIWYLCGRHDGRRLNLNIEEFTRVRVHFLHFSDLLLPEPSQSAVPCNHAVNPV